jgi:hypothetical protein
VLFGRPRGNGAALLIGSWTRELLLCCRRAAGLALLSHGMLCWGCCLALGLLFGVGAAVLGLGLGLLFVAEAGRRSCVADARLMLCFAAVLPLRGGACVAVARRMACWTGKSDAGQGCCCAVSLL